MTSPPTPPPTPPHILSAASVSQLLRCSPPPHSVSAVPPPPPRHTHSSLSIICSSHLLGCRLLFFFRLPPYSLSCSSLFGRVHFLHLVPLSPSIFCLMTSLLSSPLSPSSLPFPTLWTGLMLYCHYLTSSVSQLQ